MVRDVQSQHACLAADRQCDTAIHWIHYSDRVGHAGRVTHGIVGNELRILDHAVASSLIARVEPHVRLRPAAERVLRREERRSLDHVGLVAGRSHPLDARPIDKDVSRDVRGYALKRTDTDTKSFDRDDRLRGLRGRAGDAAREEEEQRDQPEGRPRSKRTAPASKLHVIMILIINIYSLI